VKQPKKLLPLITLVRDTCQHVEAISLTALREPHRDRVPCL